MKEPKLTEAQRKDVSKAFALVRFALPQQIDHAGPSHYICDNINRLSTYPIADAAISQATATLCKDIIKARIDCHHSFTDWLKAQSAQIKAEVHHDERHNEGRLIQTHRIAWCEMMAKEFAS